MRSRSVAVPLLATVLTLALIGSLALAGPGAANADRAPSRAALRSGPAVPKGFVPAAAQAGRRPLNRWFVVMKAPSVADAARSARAVGGALSGADQISAFETARRSQAGAIAAARSLGGTIVFRYG